MKRKRILSVLLALMMVLSVLPAFTAVKAQAETMPAEIKALQDGLNGTKDYKLTLDKDYSYTDIGATSMGNSKYAWAIVHGNNVIDLNGHKLNIKVESITDVTMLWVERGASLTILDSSAKKNGEILFDSKVDDDNTYRKRTVIRNEGTLKIYGGAFTAGHYDSYYSAYYAKTIYKMTTGDAVDNHNAAYIYGGTFTGRNHNGAAIRVSDGYTCVYDAELIGKGGASGFAANISGSSNLRVFAAYIDLYKENAVKNDGYVTKGYDYGISGITPDYLAEGYQIKEQKYTDRNSVQQNNLFYATLLDIRPGDSKPEFTFNTGDKTMNVDAAPGKGLETRFYFSPTYTLPHDLKNTDDSYISNIYFHVTLQKKASGQWVKVTEKNYTRHQTYFTLKDLYSGYENNTDYRILVSASLDYQGYNRTLNCINNSEVIIYVNVSSDKVITEAGATIAIPTAGSTVNYAITSASPSDYKAEITGWYTKSGSKLADTGKFVSGDEYFAEVKFTALSGRKLADNVVYKVNGTTCQTYTNYNTLVAHWPVKIRSNVNTIAYVPIVGVTEPYIGMKAGDNLQFDHMTVYGTGFHIDECVWYEFGDGGYTSIGDNDAFESGKDYCLQIAVKADPGYQFGNETEYDIDCLGYYVNNSRNEIYKEVAYFWTDPFTATTLQTKITFDANGGLKDDAYRGYKYVVYGQPIGSQALWYLPDGYDYTRNGYVLDGWYTERDGGVKINNTDISKYINDVTLYAHWRKQLVDTVEINGIKTPSAGQTAGSCLDCFTLPEGAHYEITSAVWYNTFLDGSGSDDVLENDYVFKADGNEAYYLEFGLAPADGYEFDQSTKILFNGSDALLDEKYNEIYNNRIWVYSVNILAAEPEYTVKVTDGKADITKTYSGQTVTLTANAPASGKVFDKWVVVSGGAKLADVTKATTTFEMPAANVEVKATYKNAPTKPVKIEKITISNADIIPVAGEKAGDHMAFTIPSGCHYTATLNGWWDIINSKIMADKDVFEPGGLYCASWNFVADDGYAFASDATVIINGSANNVDTEHSYLDTTGENPLFIISAKGVFVEAAAYTVTFNMNGHGTAVPAQTVNCGNKAAKPADPKADGFTFGGWYKDAACKTAFDFNTVITENTTVYAKWTEKKTEPEKPAFTYGDVDGNGKIEAADARLALRGAVGLKDAGIDLVNKTSVNFLAADVDLNEAIEAADARLILRYTVKLETKLGK